MVKQLFLLSIDSIVDIITNSSSDLFVCNTKATLKMLKKMLIDLIKLYNKHTNTENKFNNIFGEIWIAENISEVNDKLYNIYGREEIYHSLKFNKNIIVIESADDNSIPFIIQEWIEEVFCAERFHL